MVPYSNRIENGLFCFEHKEHRLREGDRHSIHGDVRRRAWTVTEQDTAILECALDSRACPDTNWPWPFQVEAGFGLSGKAFLQRLAVRNVSTTRMPVGMGWHPYFSRWLTRPSEPVTMQFRVSGIYPDAHNNRIPSGPAAPPPAELDFSAEKPVPPGLLFDFCGCGYDGKGHIAWPESGIRLRFECTPSCSHLVLYNPTTKPYFAVEPVTNANNGFNLLHRGDRTSGVVILEPGASLEARFDLLLELL
jgi:aldose 1-epimerase